MILARHYESPHYTGAKQFRRQFRKSPVASEEGLPIEELKANTHRIYYRRNNNSNTTENFDKNEQVLRRIENLENEIELVKIRIKNDTYSKKVLNNNKPNVRNKHETVESDVLQTKPKTEVTETWSTTKINDNTDKVPETKRNNVDGPNKDILDIKQPDVTEREFIERKQDDHQYTSQSSTTEIIKAEFTLDPTKDQGRTAYPSFEKGQDIKTDKDERNIKFNETNKSKSNKKVENTAREHDMRKSIKEMNKKDEEIISSKGTEKPLYFRNNGDVNNNRFNVSADETVKMKYVPKISHIKDVPLRNRSDNNSWVQVIYKERRFKNKNEEKKAKGNEIKDYSKPKKVNMETESKNLQDKTDNLKVYDSFVFRATDGIKNSPQTTLGSSAKNREDQFKEIEETTVDIIAAIENTFRKQTLTDNTEATISETSEKSVKQLEKEDKRMTDTPGNGNSAQNQKEEQKKEDLNTTPFISGINETLAQNFANKSRSIASNATVN